MKNVPFLSLLVLILLAIRTKVAINISGQNPDTKDTSSIAQINSFGSGFKIWIASWKPKCFLKQRCDWPKADPIRTGTCLETCWTISGQCYSKAGNFHQQSKSR
jgi:hypothetical protein